MTTHPERTRRPMTKRKQRTYAERKAITRANRLDRIAEREIGKRQRLEGRLREMAAVRLRTVRESRREAVHGSSPTYYSSAALPAGVELERLDTLAELLELLGVNL